MHISKEIAHYFATVLFLFRQKLPSVCYRTYSGAWTLLYRFFLLGYRFLYLDRLEHMASGNRYFFTDQLLDIFQIRNLFHIAKGKSDPATPGTTGTADTVHIGFRYIRQIIVDDMRKMVDIDTAGGDIGRDQDTERMILKTG